VALLGCFVDARLRARKKKKKLQEFAARKNNCLELKIIEPIDLVSSDALEGSEVDVDGVLALSVYPGVEDEVAQREVVEQQHPQHREVHHDGEAQEGTQLDPPQAIHRRHRDDCQQGEIEKGQREQPVVPPHHHNMPHPDR